jgi:hypothetical protein
MAAMKEGWQHLIQRAITANHHHACAMWQLGNKSESNLNAFWRGY